MLNKLLARENKFFNYNYYNFTQSCLRSALSLLPGTLMFKLCPC